MESVVYFFSLSTSSSSKVCLFICKYLIAQFENTCHRWAFISFWLFLFYPYKKGNYSKIFSTVKLSIFRVFVNKFIIHSISFHDMCYQILICRSSHWLFFYLCASVMKVDYVWFFWTISFLLTDNLLYFIYLNSSSWFHILTTWWSYFDFPQHNLRRSNVW